MEFDALDGRPGLSIFDPIENARFELYTSDPVALEPATREQFCFPVGDAVGFDTTRIEIPNHISAVVRTQEGEMVEDAADESAHSFGRYLLELQSTPMKLYVAVESSLTLDHGGTNTVVEFGERRRVTVGARSFHEQPVGTITVTDDIEDERAALSLLGSALKTTLCERSFPNFRGHPPRIERGESFSVPSEVTTPDTGVELVLPLEREYLYPASSLVYYLGADIVAGREPRVVAGDFEYPLDGPEGFEAAVNRVLRQVFFLDCLTRTEGHYTVDLHERQQVEPLVDLDFEALYGQSIDEQLSAYLSVPFETLDPHLLEWHLTTDVVPRAENLAVLPYITHKLPLFRTPANPNEESLEPTPDSFGDFTRAAVPEGEFTRAATPEGDFERSTSEDWAWDEGDLFQAEPVETTEHAWVGRGYPIGANKLTLDSLQRQGETLSGDSTLDVQVVCNDSQMSEENVVQEFYGGRDLVQFDVSIHEETTTDELGSLFEGSADFIHYIGHVNEYGFSCDDGFLDARSLSSVNAEAFLLNACQSYQQGKLLVERGSRGGVVTLGDILNSEATKVGRTLARLLSCGFSLRTALSVAKRGLAVPPEYVTIGDGGVTVCQGESGLAAMYRVSKQAEDFLLEHLIFAAGNYGLGSMGQSNIEEISTSSLCPGTFAEVSISGERLDSILDLETTPVEFDGEIYWSDELSSDELTI